MWSFWLHHQYLIMLHLKYNRFYCFDPLLSFFGESANVYCAGVASIASVGSFDSTYDPSMIGGSEEGALSIDNRTTPRQSRKWPRAVLRKIASRNDKMNDTSNYNHVPFPIKQVLIPICMYQKFAIAPK